MSAHTNTGRIVSNPVAHLNGEDIKLRFLTFPPVSGAVPWDHFRGTVLMAAFKDASTTRIEGSAVMVAPGVVLLAEHVLSAHEEHLKNGGEALYFFAINQNAALDVWKAEGLVSLARPFCDLALVMCKLQSSISNDGGIYIAPIADRWPAVGEPVMFAGFVAGEMSFPASDLTQNYKGQMTASVGTVLTHYPEKRDSVTLKFPCIEVGVFVSGGPAFDKDGMLVGTFVYSMEVEGDHDGPGYFVPIEKVLDIKIEPPFGTGLTTLRQLNNTAALIRP